MRASARRRRRVRRRPGDASLHAGRADASPGRATPHPGDRRSLVVGAGPAGLAAAWRAALAGHEVTVVERPTTSAAWRPATRSPGCGSTTAATACTRRRRRAARRAPRPARRRPPGPAPPRAHPARRALGRLPAARRRPAPQPAAAAFAARRRRRRRPRPAAPGPRDDTFAEVVRAGLGPTVADEFYGPYVRKLWGVDAARPGRRARPPAGAARPSPARHRPPARAREPTRGADVPLPPARLRADQRGAGRRRRRRRRRPSASASAWQHARRCARTARSPRLDDGPRARRRSASCPPLPLAALAGVVPDRPRRRRSSSRRPARHRAIVLVYLVLDRPRWTEFDAHYFPDLGHPVARLSEPKNYRDSADDPPTAPCCAPRCPASRRRRRGTATPDELGERVGRRPRAAWACPPSTRSARRGASGCPRVYPVYRPGFEWDLAALDALARTSTSRRCSPSAARACSCPTTPTTPWPWAGPPPTRLAARRLVRREAAWAAARAAFRDLRRRGLTTPVRGRRRSGGGVAGTSVGRPVVGGLGPELGPHRGDDLAQVGPEPHERPAGACGTGRRSAPRRSGSPWPTQVERQHLRVVVVVDDLGGGRRRGREGPVAALAVGQPGTPASAAAPHRGEHPVAEPRGAGACWRSPPAKREPTT